jgi:hypothetical protein
LQRLAFALEISGGAKISLIGEGQRVNRLPIWRIKVQVNSGLVGPHAPASHLTKA